MVARENYHQHFHLMLNRLHKVYKMIRLHRIKDGRRILTRVIRVVRGKKLESMAIDGEIKILTKFFNNVQD